MGKGPGKLSTVWRFHTGPGLAFWKQQWTLSAHTQALMNNFPVWAGPLWMFPFPWVLFPVWTLRGSRWHSQLKAGRLGPNRVGSRHLEFSILSKGANCLPRHTQCAGRNCPKTLWALDMWAAASPRTVHPLALGRLICRTWTQKPEPLLTSACSLISSLISCPVHPCSTFLTLLPPKKIPYPWKPFQFLRQFHSCPDTWAWEPRERSLCLNLSQDSLPCAVGQSWLTSLRPMKVS